MTSESRDLQFKTFNEPVGLSGWLILPGLGLFFSVFQHIASVVHIVSYLKPDTWNALTSPASPAYDPWWAPLLIFEFAGTVALMMLEILLLYLFRGRKRALPQLMIAWFVAVALFSVTDTLISGNIASLASEGPRLSGIVRAVVPCLVWIPYFLTSRRVKATFVS